MRLYQNFDLEVFKLKPRCFWEFQTSINFFPFYQSHLGADFSECKIQPTQDRHYRFSQNKNNFQEGPEDGSIRTFSSNQGLPLACLSLGQPFFSQKNLLWLTLISFIIFKNIYLLHSNSFIIRSPCFIQKPWKHTKYQKNPLMNIPQSIRHFHSFLKTQMNIFLKDQNFTNKNNL